MIELDHNAVETMEACSEIDTVLAPAVICKKSVSLQFPENKNFIYFLFEETRDLTQKVFRLRSEVQDCLLLLMNIWKNILIIRPALQVC